MEQYCIISGTNRVGSTTLQIAEHYLDLLLSYERQVTLLSLENWHYLHRDEAFRQLELEKLVPADKFIFISPEYNGSIPGVLKVMIDISDHRKVWTGKKALLTGISSGRAGNLRGMDHLTGILHYLQVVVHPNKLPISSVDHLMDQDGKLIDEGTLHAVRDQVQQFIKF
jgi:chromate reductase, NAD(P)H dehydrogenase (quinone)